jgi:hypothetical protein
MRGNAWKASVAGKPDGTVKRLGPGHAWVWTRDDGSTETFDCGLSISHVLEYMARRLKVPARAVDLTQA